MNLDDVASPKYRSVLRASHASVKGWGGGGKSHAETIKQWATEIGATSILDYGCGRGTLKDAIDIPVAEFDPGIVGKDKMPEPADMVVATDVLEHFEPQLVHNGLRHIRELTRKGNFFVIALTKAKFHLVNGHNAHLTIMPSDWWLAQLAKYGFKIERYERRKGLWVWTR